MPCTYTMYIHVDTHELIFVNPNPKHYTLFNNQILLWHTDQVGHHCVFWTVFIGATVATVDHNDYVDHMVTCWCHWMWIYWWLVNTMVMLLMVMTVSTYLLTPFIDNTTTYTKDVCVRDRLTFTQVNKDNHHPVQSTYIPNTILCLECMWIGLGGGCLCLLVWASNGHEHI